LSLAIHAAAFRDQKQKRNEKQRVKNESFLNQVVRFHVREKKREKEKEKERNVLLEGDIIELLLSTKAADCSTCQSLPGVLLLIKYHNQNSCQKSIVLKI
jgi:predicted phage gp36 major capsid-like protein